MVYYFVVGGECCGIKTFAAKELDNCEYCGKPTAKKAVKKGGRVFVRRSMQSDRIGFFKSEAREIIFRRGNYSKIFFSFTLLLLLNIGTSELVRGVCRLCSFDAGVAYEFAAQYVSFALYLLVVVPAGAGMYLCALRATVTAGVFPPPSTLLTPFACKNTISRIYSCYFVYFWRFLFLFGVARIGLYVANRTFGNLAVKELFFAGFFLAAVICLLTYFALCLFFILFSGVYPLLTLVLRRDDISIKNAKKYSKKIMRSHRLEIFELQSSFVLLFLFSAATFGILFVAYTLPYFLLTNALYSSYLIDTKL